MSVAFYAAFFFLSWAVAVSIWAVLGERAKKRCLDYCYEAVEHYGVGSERAIAYSDMAAVLVLDGKCEAKWKLRDRPRTVRPNPIRSRERGPL